MCELRFDNKHMIVSHVVCIFVDLENLPVPEAQLTLPELLQMLPLARSSASPRSNAFLNTFNSVWTGGETISTVLGHLLRAAHTTTSSESVLRSRQQTICEKLQAALDPVVLDLDDVSHKHAGHAGVQSGATETHFNLKIVSSKFEGKTLVKRHRLVYDLLQEELQTGLHALSIVAKTRAEDEGV